MRPLALVLVCLALCGGATRAAAEERPAVAALSDEELETRTRFLERAILKNAHYTKTWHGLFTTGYGLGFAYEAARAVEARHGGAHQADYAIGAGKAAVGVIGRMARAPRAVFGQTPEEAAPGTDRESRERRLAVAEAMLKQDAHDNDRRYSWIGHGLNVALNVAGLLVIGLRYHDWALAGQSTGISIGVGELSIWTQPWQAKSAWKEYSHEYRPVGGPSPLTQGARAPGSSSIPENGASALSVSF